MIDNGTYRSRLSYGNKAKNQFGMHFGGLKVSKYHPDPVNSFCIAIL